HYTFFNQIDQAAKLGNALYSSLYVHRFLHKEYETNLEYYESYNLFFDDTLLKLVEGQSGLFFKIYIDNDTITNGAEFQRLEKAEGTDWYKYVNESGLQKGLFFGRKMGTNNVMERTIYYFQRLNYYDNSSKNLVVIEVDYDNLVTLIENLNYENKAYICDDEHILMSNGRYSNVSKDYSSVKKLGDMGYTQDISVYGKDMVIKVENSRRSPLGALSRYWYQVLFVVLVSIMLPIFVIELMKSAYKNKLKEQETVVAQKNAELLALHSQINPHFLFNALESIRMHSLLKQETETSEMVEHLAKLQRQYTEWNDDSIQIEKEIEFVQAYLELQKYRFGDRLSFDIDVDDETGKFYIPKLTIVTFAENACIHGIESKNTPGWIFVRVFIEDNNMIMEIEDTGSGMTEEARLEILNKMKNASIEMLKEKGRVGVVNACLRLKMITDNEVKFDIDSEPGAGTLIQIKLPVKYVKERV
nr:histidine kinase [Lachnospiraceae bacterium]